MENIGVSIFSMAITRISKEKIVEIALQGFLHSGIQSFTVKQLTELAGISTKTVYKIFEDKTALLRACLRTHYSCLADELLELDTGNEIESVLNIMHRLVDLEFRVNPRFYAELNAYYPKLQDEVNATPNKVIEKLKENMQTGIQDGLFLADLNPNISLIAFQQLYTGITREKIYDPLKLQGPELIKNTILIYLRGMCTPLGLQKLQHYEKSL